MRAAGIPTLVVRGAWDKTPPEARAAGMRTLHAVCDVLVAGLDAQSETFTGAAHNPQLLGPPFNERLRAFWSSAA